MFFSDSGVTHPPTVVGHRGFPARHPDNTLAGFAEAFSVVAMVETDVRRTSDGVLVLAHDPSIAGMIVSDTSWQELSGLDVGEGHHPCRLDQALAAFPDAAWNLEIKNDPGDPGFEQDLEIAVDTAAHADDRDLITSFFWPNVDRVAAELPLLRTGLLVEEGIAVRDAITHAHANGHAAVVPRFTMLVEDIEVIEEARRCGIAVIAWTVNDPRVAVRLAEAGIAAIITDDPTMILEALK